MGSRLKTQTIKSRRHVVWQRQRRSCVIKKQPTLNYKTTIVPNSSNSSSSERKAAAGVDVMMSHKYKPRVFQDIVGHKTVIKTLSNAIQHKKIAPLYLFHGPNGTGKTSTATLFAMALNCQSTHHHTKPCCTCKPCTSFKATTTICSANTIATAFHKIKTTSILTTAALTQILIIEECHLLTSEAWDELMNLLDSNPSLVFLLITTTHSINNRNNIPNHISSRCHKFCFPKLKDEDITKKLSTILHHEGMSIQKQAMKLIVAKSQGSLRDAENILDQLALLGPRINTSVTQHLVGLIPQNKLLDLLAVALSGDTINTIRYAKKLSASVEPASFLSQLATLVTNVLLESSSSPHKQLLSKTHSARLCYILKLLAETERKLHSSTDQNWNIIAAFLDITSSSIVLPNSSSFSQVTLHSGEPHRSTDEHQRQLDGVKRSSISDMEELWKDVLEGIESSHTRKFLRDQVKLALLSISRTNAIVHLTFQRPEDKLAAEISEESLTKALEVAIGCPVTLRMSLEPLTLGQDGKSRRHPQQQNAATHIPESSGFNRNDESLIIGEPSAESSRLRKSKSCSTSQRPHRYSSKGRDLNTAQLQNLSPVSPECHLTNQRRHLDLIQAAEGDSKNAKQIMRANRPRHRWLSLSSIPQSDASVECYSQDVKYENSNKDGDDTVRKIPKFQKGLSKSSKDRRFQEPEDQLQSNPAWYSVDTCC